MIVHTVLPLYYYYYLAEARVNKLYYRKCMLNYNITVLNEWDKYMKYITRFYIKYFKGHCFM